MNHLSVHSVFPSVEVTYAISVFTGNRWGADFDADLFMELWGEKGESGKIWLKQESSDQKFLQNQVQPQRQLPNQLVNQGSVPWGEEMPDYRWIHLMWNFRISEHFKN